VVAAPAHFPPPHAGRVTAERDGFRYHPLTGAWR
jgi:hypothetical protein